MIEEMEHPKTTLKLLYTTPESLIKGPLIAHLKVLLSHKAHIFNDRFKVAYENGCLFSIAIDEAHCISTWGHDFRPAYQRLALLRDHFRNIPFVALTVCHSCQTANK